MKNKRINDFFVAIFVVLFGTTNLALATPKHLIHLNSDVVKLLIAMVGVGVFFVIISIGLSFYNRFFVPIERKDYKLSKDSLRPPTDKDEAIIMFLTKNKMK